MNRMEVTMHYDLMLAALLLTTTSGDGPASHVHRTQETPQAGCILPRKRQCRAGSRILQAQCHRVGAKVRKRHLPRSAYS